jgi:hypothetical protein
MKVGYFHFNTAGNFENVTKVLPLFAKLCASLRIYASPPRSQRKRRTIMLKVVDFNFFSLAGINNWAEMIELLELQGVI